MTTSTTPPAAAPACTLAALQLHPVKSCAGIEVPEALLVETGLELDRVFMVVDPAGAMLTQRELPRMALIRPALRSEEMVLRAPGMLALHVRLDTVEAATRVQVWRDIVKAFDMGALAAQWFSDFLGRPLRLVRFDPDERRLSDPAWTGALQAETAFADGFALLVTNAASLDDLNARLALRGAAPVTMARFRPNLVLAGLQPYDEDHLAAIEIDTADGPVRLRLVKPCVRCSIPNIDLAGAEIGAGPGADPADPGAEPGATLAGYRADPRLQGGITFGVNAIVEQGLEHRLRPGQTVRPVWAFD